MKKYKLGELLDVTRGASLTGEYYSTEGEFIRLTLGNFDYQNGGFKENTSKDDLFFTGTVKPQFILNEGDIITPLTEQTQGLIGSTARIPQSGVFIQSQDVGLVKCNEELLDPDFCYYLLPSQIVKKQLSAGAQQTKIRHTSPDKIKDVTVFLPELSEQKKIGHILRSIDSQIDNLTAINRNLEQSVEHAYQFMFFSKQRPRLSLKSMESIATIKAGGDCPTKYSRSKTSQYQIPIYSNSIDKDGLYGFAEKAVILEPGITIAARGTIGFCALRTKPYVPIIRLLSVSPHDRGGDIYLYQFFKKVVFEKNGSVQQQLTVPMLSCITIPYPSKEELNKFDKIVRPFIIMQSCNKENIEALQKLRDELLPLLLNGQVQVNCDLSN